MRPTILFAALLFAQPLESLRFGRARVAESIRRRHGGITVAVEDVRKENVALIARTCEALGLASIHLIYTPEMVPQTRAFARLSDKLKRVTLSRISRSATDWIRVETHASTLGPSTYEPYAPLGHAIPRETTPGGAGGLRYSFSASAFYSRSPSRAKLRVEEEVREEEEQEGSPAGAAAESPA